MSALSDPRTVAAAGAAPSRAASAPAGGGMSPLLEAVVGATTAAAGPQAPWARQFLLEPDPAKALALWLLLARMPAAPGDGPRLARALGRQIAEIDRLLSAQVNAILHHPRLQRLEASWRGLRYLVERVEDDENVKIRVLDVAWHELARDAERAIEFDQSQLFRKVYSEEYDTPGGQPFGLLLGDYEIRHCPSADHPVDDLATLKAVSGVAAAAFAPFIAGADPGILGMNSFTQLEQPVRLLRTVEQVEYLKWRALRETEDARFLGLTLPRVLARLPYEDDPARGDGFRYREDVAGPDRSKYLWGTGVYAFGSVVVRAFAQSGWLADIRGVVPGVETGGLVCDLPVHDFSTDRAGIAMKASSDAVIPDRQEPELGELGFISLCHSKGTEYSAFYTCPSIQKAKKYDDPAATANARVASMLQYTLCVSRFAHFLKAFVRDRLGGFSDPQQCEDEIYRWLQNYVTPDREASAEVKARLPLREARVQVREHPAKPGSYWCTAHLWPHFQLDELAATLKVTTELTSGRRG